MVRAYSVIANKGFITDIHFIDSIQDRFGNIIFSNDNFTSQSNVKNIKRSGLIITGKKKEGVS